MYGDKNLLKIYEQNKSVVIKDKNDITFYIKAGEILTEQELNFIQKVNKLLSDIAIDDKRNMLLQKVEEIVDMIDLRFVYNGEYLPNIKISYEKRNFHQFDEKIKSIKLNSFDMEKNLEMEEFEKALSLREDSVLFFSEYFDDSDNNKINQLDLNKFFNDEFISAIKIIQDDINSYNDIVDKIDYELPIKKIYGCIRGVWLVCDETYYCSVNKTILLLLICYLNLDNLVFYINKRQKEIDEEDERKLLADIKKCDDRIEEIKREIKNDPEFWKCKKEEMRIRYLKTFLKDDSDDVLSFLQLKRRHDGLCVNGYKCVAFINDLWEEINFK